VDGNIMSLGSGKERDKERAKALEAAKQVFKNQEAIKDFAHQIIRVIDQGSLVIDRKRVMPVVLKLTMKDQSILMLQLDPFTGKLISKEAYV
jgi:hypothetical protein